jgi:hypothetical protein
LVRQWRVGRAHADTQGRSVAVVIVSNIVLRPVFGVLSEVRDIACPAVEREPFVPREVILTRIDHPHFYVGVFGLPAWLAGRRRPRKRMKKQYSPPLFNAREC